MFRQFLLYKICKFFFKRFIFRQGPEFLYTIFLLADEPVPRHLEQNAGKVAPIPETFRGLYAVHNWQSGWNLGFWWINGVKTESNWPWILRKAKDKEAGSATILTNTPRPSEIINKIYKNWLLFFFLLGACLCLSQCCQNCFRGKGQIFADFQKKIANFLAIKLLKNLKTH